MASTVTITLKDKEGNQVAVHDITVESMIPEVFLEKGVPYILRRILTGKQDAIASEPSSVYSFDTSQPVASLNFAKSE